MSQLSANTCNIVTIFPLGVICNPTDAFKPNTPNGSIQLNISGGTPPYTTSWSNGQQGNFITNLLIYDIIYSAIRLIFDYSNKNNNYETCISFYPSIIRSGIL